MALMWIIPVARADDELAGYLESAMHAEFHGSGVVMCVWGADSAATTYEISRTDGMSMVTGPDGEFITHDGMTASLSGTDWYALEVAEWTAWSMSDRYRLGDPVATERLGRPATEITVLEGDMVRARIILDDASTVPLLTEIYNGAGDVFRMSALVEFQPGVPEMPDMPEDFVEYEMVMPDEASGDLPAEVGGYTRTDTYGLGSSTQSFYSDGLFTFSVFEAGRGATPVDFRTATLMVMDGRPYRRIISPNNVWVQWSSPEHSYVLVGDLPPDHISQVLEGMPAPGTRGVIMRLLHRFFG
jgi:hypothetical protein